VEQDRTLSLFLTDPANEFLQVLKTDAMAAARAAGFELETFFADNQAMTQIQQIYEVMHREGPRRPLAVLVMPMRDASFERVARYAAKEGIAWICLHRATGDLAALRREFPGVPIALVGPDQAEIGRIHGRQAQRLLPLGGQVLYIRGSAGNASSRERMAGMEEVIAGTAVSIRTVLDGNWTEAEAEQVVREWLRVVGSGRSEIQMAVCQSDTMAIGTRKALDGDRELLHIPVIGCDGVLHVGRKLVDARRLAATVVIPATAAIAVSLVMKALNGETVPEELIVKPTSYPPDLVAG
jgi:ribose transport system substrate-binding protein